MFPSYSIVIPLEQGLRLLSLADTGSSAENSIVIPLEQGLRQRSCSFCALCEDSIVIPLEQGLRQILTLHSLEHRV